MPPKTKASTETNLLGQPSSFFREEFILANELGKPDHDILPFEGPLQLPCKEQVLRLYLYYRDQAGKFNNAVSPNNLATKVAPHVIKYWSMAGFQTMVLERVKNNIRKEVDKYQAINKNISRSSETEMKKRKEYLSILAQLFDIACKDLDQMLVKDRLLAADDKDNRYMAKEGYTRKVEDLAFLEDQRGARKMIMGMRDSSFEERLNQNLKKR